MLPFLVQLLVSHICTHVRDYIDRAAIMQSLCADIGHVNTSSPASTMVRMLVSAVHDVPNVLLSGSHAASTTSQPRDGTNPVSLL